MTPYLITAAILFLTIAYCLHQNHRGPRIPDRVDQMIHAERLIERYRIETLADIVSEPQNLAWPPLIERLPPRIAADPCGCIWFEDGYWSPCRVHDSGVLAAFIDTNADQWAADLAEGGES